MWKTVQRSKSVAEAGGALQKEASGSDEAEGCAQFERA